MRRLPLHLVVSLLAVHVVAFGVFVGAAVDACAGGWGTALLSGALGFGATAALCERTWGVGLVLAAATSFFAARALGLGPAYFDAVAAIGALPFLFTAKHMARFSRGATVLFALLAGAAGTTVTLAQLFAR